MVGFKYFCKRYCTFLVVPVTFLGLMVPSVNAECSRDDIDHYLDKGFTPAQITSICGNTPVQPIAPVVQQAPVIKQPPVKVPVSRSPVQPPVKSTTQYVQPVQPVQQTESSRNFLVDVINGYDTVQTSDALMYTVKKCYEIGEEDLFGFAPEICPEIRYTLNLNGMTIVDTGRKYFIFGPPEIVLVGSIRRDILTDLKDITPKQKELLYEQIDTGDKVVLLFQQGTPMERVKTELHKILR